MASTIAKAELENMLEILTIDTLTDINRKIVAEEPYSWGRTPLLKYAPEALADYAAAIYRHVITPLTPKVLSDYLKQYLTTWLSFYESAETMFKAASVDYAYRLLEISRTPISELPTNFIDEDESVYDLITDYFDGKSYDLYPQFSNFLYSYLSPLRRLDLTDQRLIDLVKEADELLAPYNTALEDFIGRELKRLRVLVTDRLRYVKLNPADIDTLKINKSRIPADDWQAIEKALNTGFLSDSTLKLVNKTIKDIKTDVPAPTTPAKPNKPLMPLKDYMDCFLVELERGYDRLMAKRAEIYASNVSPLDDILAGFRASQRAASQGISIDDIEATQAKGWEFFTQFGNIKPILLACLQIDLYNLSVDTVFASDILNHGVIQGILAFTYKLRPQFKYRTLTLMYDRLAEELYSTISEHTCGFADALPLPEVTPLTDDAIAAMPKAPRVTTNSMILPFDLTPPIQATLSNLGADTITTDTKILSVIPDPKALTPIDDPTIKNVAYCLTGVASTPYLLNGDLVIHNQQTDQYIKVIPSIREDGYADYVFMAYNHKALSSRVNTLQTLLFASPKYRSSVQHIGAPLPLCDPQKRQKVIKDLQEWDSLLLTQANDLYKHDDDTKSAIRQIAQTSYYKAIYLSAHRLAAYVYYPKEYSAFISAKPTDPETGVQLQYELNHKDGCRSHNCPANLEFKSKQTNLDLRSTSRPVYYKDANYTTLKAYCEATNAGNYKNLNQALTGLQTGDAVVYNGRHYSLTADGLIIAIDSEAARVLTYNGTVYANPKEFADAHNLPYKSLHNALSKARKAGKDNFNYKQYKFYLDVNGNIIEVTK